MSSGPGSSEVSKQSIKSDLSVASVLADLAGPAAIDQNKLTSLIETVQRSLRSRKEEALQAGREAVDAICELIPTDAFCEKVRERLRESEPEVKKLGNWPLITPSNELSESVPTGEGTAKGFSPAMAVALDLLPRESKTKRLMASFEYQITPEDVLLVRDALKPLMELEVAVGEKLRGKRTLKPSDLAQLDPTISEHLASIDKNAPGIWLLAASHVSTQGEIDSSSFMDQLREWQYLRDNPQARIEAAVTEYFLMSKSYGPEPRILQGTVPVGERERCAESAFLDGHPFAVRYAPQEQVFYVRTMHPSLGLERYIFDEKGSGLVNDDPQHARCASLHTLSEVLEIAREKFSDQIRPLEAPKTLNEKVTWLMVAELQRTEPKRVSEFLEKWSSYAPSKQVVREMCLAARVLNPWKAAQALQPTFAPFSEVPEHRLEELREENGTLQQSKRFAARSAAGPALTTGRIVRSFVPGDLGSHGVLTGVQAAVSFFSEWGTQKLDEEVLERSRSTQKRKLARPLHRFELEEQSEAVGATSIDSDAEKGLILRRRLELLTEVNEEIERSLHALDRLQPGGVYDAASKSYALRYQDLQSSRMAKFFEDKRDELPERIVLTYDNFISGLYAADPQREKQSLIDLQRYFDQSATVNREAALRPYKLDLQWYEALPENDSIRQELGPPGVMRLRARHLVDAAGPIREVDVDQVYESYRIAELRQAGNSRVFHPHAPDSPEAVALQRESANFAQFSREEYDNALQYFRPLFFDKAGNLKERQSGVPMSRLRETLEAAVLMQHDFAAVREALIVDLVTSDDRRFFGAKPCEDFAEMVSSVIGAYRKIQHLRNVLKDEGLLHGVDRNQVSDFLSSHKHVLWRGKNVHPIEHLQNIRELQEEAVKLGPRKYKMTLPEMFARLDESKSMQYTEKIDEIRKGVKDLGLFSLKKDGFAESLELLYDQAHNVVEQVGTQNSCLAKSARLVSKLSEEVDEIVASPLVRGPSLEERYSDRRFFKSEEIREMFSLRGIRPELEALEPSALRLSRNLPEGVDSVLELTKRRTPSEEPAEASPLGGALVPLRAAEALFSEGQVVQNLALLGLVSTESGDLREEVRKIIPAREYYPSHAILELVREYVPDKEAKDLALETKPTLQFFDELASKVILSKALNISSEEATVLLRKYADHTEFLLPENLSDIVQLHSDLSPEQITELMAKQRPVEPCYSRLGAVEMLRGHSTLSSDYQIAVALERSYCVRLYDTECIKSLLMGMRVKDLDQKVSEMICENAELRPYLPKVVSELLAQQTQMDQREREHYSRFKPIDMELWIPSRLRESSSS